MEAHGRQGIENQNSLPGTYCPAFKVAKGFLGVHRECFHSSMPLRQQSIRITVAS
jgi:hypothetical protein